MLTFQPRVDHDPKPNTTPNVLHQKLKKKRHSKGRTKRSPSYKAARRSRYLRQVPFVKDIVAFLRWYDGTFPGRSDSKDPALHIANVYRFLRCSTRGASFPCPYSLLSLLIKRGRRKPNRKLERGVLDIVEDVSKAVGVQYIEHSIPAQKARCLPPIDRDRALCLLEEWHSHRAHSSDPKGRHPVTGETRYTVKSKRRQSLKALRKHELAKEENKDILSMILHLQSQDKNLELLLDRLDAHISVVSTKRAALLNNACSLNEQKKIEDEYEIRLRQLHDCQDNNVGYVWRRTKPHSYRIFPMGMSLQNLHRSDRHAVTLWEAGYVEVDLSSAHLAISNKLFGGGRATKKLLCSRRIWPILLDYIGYDAADKDLLKETLYSILYGSSDRMQKVLLIRNAASKRALLKQKLDDLRGEQTRIGFKFTSRQKKSVHKTVDDALKNEKEAVQAWSDLLAHPAIAELQKGRKSLVKSIRSAKGMRDAFGNWQRLDDCNDNPARVIHAIASSYEKILLKPIYDYAIEKNSRGFSVLVDQHDGVLLYFKRTDGGRRENILARLRDLVHKKAAELDINTQLEIKNQGGGNV